LFQALLVFYLWFFSPSLVVVLGPFSSSLLVVILIYKFLKVVSLKSSSLSMWPPSIVPWTVKVTDKYLLSERTILLLKHSQIKMEPFWLRSYWKVTRNYKNTLSGWWAPHSHKVESIESTIIFSDQVAGCASDTLGSAELQKLLPSQPSVSMAAHAVLRSACWNANKLICQASFKSLGLRSLACRTIVS
jgi:hypothetical protein